jgi:hypothetical protein
MSQNPMDRALISQILTGWDLNSQDLIDLDFISKDHRSWGLMSRDLTDPDHRLGPYESGPWIGPLSVRN